MKLSDIADKCSEIGCAVIPNACMQEYTSFQIGGPADLLITAHTAEQIKKVYELCSQHQVPVLVLGNGSNLLVGDSGIRGVVLRLEGTEQPQIENNILSCGAGISLKRLCLFARDSGLAGLEFAYGIPGTVGGAVYMNAGAYGGQMADVLSYADVVCPNEEIRTINTSEMRLGYRQSVFMQSNMVIVSAGFRLCPDEPSAIGERMNAILKRRREKQPLEYPSAGSFFKRPEGNYAGTLIEKSGLKGYSVGGAQVSEKHAGFVINRGGATCADILRLSEIVRERVFREHGILLEQEVRFVGEQ